MTSASIPAYDNVSGNHYDKYATRNPIARWLMDGFLRSFDELTGLTSVGRAFEVGCGEGHLSLRLEAAGLSVGGVDLEADAVVQARANAADQGAAADFNVANLFDLDPATHRAPLIVSCEVLEHVPSPEAALDVLTALADPWLLVSVPNEPVWRALNLCRGKYVGDFGNTPGHIQHWSTAGFKALVGSKARIIETRTPLPWTMLLCRCD